MALPDSTTALLYLTRLQPLTARSPLKHPRVVTVWGTRRSTTELEVSQAIRQIGCTNLQIERQTSKSTPQRWGTWRFVILGKEQDIAYLEDNWKEMPKWWKLQCPASPKSSPDNFQQGFPFPEHLPQRPPIQTGMIQRCPPAQIRLLPFIYSPLPQLNLPTLKPRSLVSDSHCPLKLGC